GGAVYMNAGSGKYNISDYLHSVKVFKADGSEIIYNKEYLDFKRRYSILQKSREIINSICFKFKKGRIDTKRIQETLEYRTQLPKYPSAGGIFKNWHELKPYRKKLVGLRVGDAVISDKVNIIVNKGNATYNDIVHLINKITEIVKINLKLEIKVLG
ncbi:MAG: hypothetical protein ACOC56_05575, partial [Atribacterota bacterium]